ncbi:MAG: phosphoribosylglycinamide synthetase C domain-containing protein, partial [Patescibacteria group bacterium]
GMGTITPLPFINEELIQTINTEIVAPTFEAMRKEENPFEGVLYPGLMLTPSGPKILEYNARFGDPETQIYMRLLETDLLDIIDACIDKKLSDIEIKWKNKACCNIVLASGGYPNAYEKGKAISGIDEAELNHDIVVFHAGTAMKDGNLVTNGGRVLGVSAVADTLEDALKLAYDAIPKISFEGMQYRRDIGQKALS